MVEAAVLRGAIIFLYTTTLGVVWWDLLHGSGCWAWIVLAMGLLLVFVRIVLGNRIAEKFDQLRKLAVR
jgi:hypothetical protein